MFGTFYVMALTSNKPSTIESRSLCPKSMRLPRNTQQLHAIHRVSGINCPLAITLVPIQQSVLLFKPRLTLAVVLQICLKRLVSLRLPAQRLHPEDRNNLFPVLLKLFKASICASCKCRVVFTKILHRERFWCTLETLQEGVPRLDTFIQRKRKVCWKLYTCLQIPT